MKKTQTFDFDFDQKKISSDIFKLSHILIQFANAKSKQQLYFDQIFISDWVLGYVISSDDSERNDARVQFMLR